MAGYQIVVTVVAKEIEMTIKGDPTNWVEFVLERFIYNYETGTVHWRSQHSADGCGSLITQSLTNAGYLTSWVCGKNIKVHHIVWLLTTGKKPAEVMQLDHIDGNKQNNHHTNLREVDRSTNRHNTKSKGYTWHKKAKKWRATIMVAGKRHHLGYFTTEEEARTAYEAAKKLHGFIHR